MIEDRPSWSEELTWLIVETLELRLQLRFLGKQTRSLLASLQYFQDFQVSLSCRVRRPPGTFSFDQLLDLTFCSLPLLLFFIWGDPC